jgi:hypothetical protein
MKQKNKPDITQTPPRAPLVLRVGVTGHRPEPDDLPDEDRKRPAPDIASITATIKEVLDVIRVSFKGIADSNGQLFDLTPTATSQPGGGILRIVSALASGPDQWVAKEAIGLGFELQAVLPFDRYEYLKDFTAESDISNYHQLLEKAKAVLELDGKVKTDISGNRKPDNQSYEAVGRALLNQTDLLIAVWDGKEAQGRGGTGQVVREALQNGIPVIGIPWDSAEGWRVRKSPWHLYEEAADLAGDNDRLMEVVQKLLLPPDENSFPDIESGVSLRNEYFKEGQKNGSPQLGIWLLFRNLVCGKIFKKGGFKDIYKVFLVENFEEKEKENIQNDWITKKSEDQPMDHPFGDKIRTWVDDRYFKHYAWANGLSVFYGNLHRSAFIINYLLSSIAVFLALVCIAHQIKGTGQTGWILAELVVIFGILALTRRGQVKCWHQRWIDYRTLAERLRVARCQALYGGGRQQVVYEGHLTSYGNPSNTWMNWHIRAIERAAGLPTASLTSEYLASCQEFWKESLVQDQINYHKTGFVNFKKMDRRLHKTGDFLFTATLIACMIHLAHIWLEGDMRFDWMPPNTGGWMTMLCAFLPALGAAFAAIRSHSEVQRLTQRSKAMEETLEQLKIDLASVPVTGNSLNSVQLRNKTDRVSNLMTNEMLDWRVVFQDRPLGLPV